MYVYVGNASTSTGMIEVIGPDITAPNLDSVRDTVIGISGNGAMRILNGGLVRTNGEGIIADGGSSTGTVVVSGFNAFPSEWYIDNDLTVGHNGNGALQILDGGLVDPVTTWIGRNAGSMGRVLVDGAGSMLLNVGTIFVGGDAGGPGGDGELRITNGGSVSAGALTVWGAGSGGPGVLAVDSTYNIISGALTFDGGILRFLDDTDFTDSASLNNTGPVGVFVDTNGTTSTISSFLSGPGGLTVRDSGTLFLTNFNGYTGDTTVTDSANLFIDGSVAGDTRVNFNAFLGGTYSGGPANVGGNLISRGIVSPGDFPGDPEVFFVQKDFHNLVDGAVITEVGSLTEGNGSDLLYVYRAADIQGGTIVVPRINNFMPLPGDRVTVIETNLGRSGSFDTLIPINWLGLIQPLDLYDDPFTVDIGFFLSNTFESQGITRNQRAVGAALDNAFLDNCVPRVISFVGNEPLVNLPYDYDLIAPEELASIYEMGFTQANMQGVNLMQRMDDIRAGSTGFCSSVAMEMPAPSYSKESDGKEVLNKNPVPAFVPTPENRWGIWATGSGQFVNVGGDDDNATGYDLSNGNFTVGIDYRLLHNLAFGIYGGYDAGVANLVNDGRITTNGGNVGGFATWSWDRFYVDVSGGGTWNNYKTRRAALLGDAVGSTKGSQYNVLGALGYDWRFGCWNIGPRATFQYTDVTIDQFRERGSLAPLNFPDQNEDSLQSTVGVRASYDLHPSKTVIIRPELNVAWLHEYNDRAYPIDAGFLGCPGGFTVYGPNVGRDGAQVRAGASAQLNPAFAIYVYYDGLLGRGNYRQQRRKRRLYLELLGDHRLTEIVVGQPHRLPFTSWQAERLPYNACTSSRALTLSKTVLAGRQNGHARRVQLPGSCTMRGRAPSVIWHSPHILNRSPR